ncbi:shikimate dehydrogenase [Acidisoma cellulosilytica]|uniref:Shikimate dehydrogenase (NADP(+)) n=1 Tax=Acidisoma cellulosilyticum TaxID=2802395 RepID=A0A963YZK6_9PROT|nr:shikimate dehydrogenase [Acidisoma cellulosilyticum]MCB8879095.1 shikimate dehydrogenase [Acidisoma cellulosilyticum]
MAILSGQARLAGVIGWPVAHSRSPRLHGFWLNRHGIDGAYLPLPVRPEDFQTAVRGLVASGFAGANVTIPHKEAAFAVCDRVDPFAHAAGAVNTLVFQDGRITGTNTDGIGFLENLRQHGIDPAAGPALLLGAGGAARAIAAALLGLGVDVTLTNRTPERAEAMAQALPGCRTLPWAAREHALADQALTVNTTSLGMTGHQTLMLDLGRAAATTAIADIVYVPLETPLIAAAKTRGLKTAPGLGMLLHQAVPGFAAWFGVTPVVDDALYDFVAADLLPRRR